MKKYFVLFAVAFLVIFGVSAQDAASSDAPAATEVPADTSVKVIVPKNQHTTSKTANVRIEYTPMTDEVRIYYTCLDVSFDQGEAMNTILACLKDFQAENQYYGFTYLAKDKTRYYKDSNNMKWASYMSNVKFSR